MDRAIRLGQVVYSLPFLLASYVVGLTVGACVSGYKSGRADANDMGDI